MEKESYEQLLHLIRVSERLRLKAYLCPAGIPTIGYGATGKDIKLGLVWTKEQAEEALRIFVNNLIPKVKKACPRATDIQLIALVDFTYNLGIARLLGSTLRKKFNAGDIEGAKRELMKWVRGGGKILKGLVIRREREARFL